MEDGFDPCCDQSWGCEFHARFIGDDEAEAPVNSEDKPNPLQLLVATPLVEGGRDDLRDDGRCGSHDGESAHGPGLRILSPYTCCEYPGLSILSPSAFCKDSGLFDDHASGVELPQEADPTASLTAVSSGNRGVDASPVLPLQASLLSGIGDTRGTKFAQPTARDGFGRECDDAATACDHGGDHNGHLPALPPWPLPYTEKAAADDPVDRGPEDAITDEGAAPMKRDDTMLHDGFERGAGSAGWLCFDQGDTWADAESEGSQPPSASPPQPRGAEATAADSSCHEQ